MDQATFAMHVRPEHASGGPSLGVWALWMFRALLVVPFVLMGPEIVAVLAGRTDAVANISSSTADVLGTSTFLIFALMLAVTPVQTVTGWRWHVVLRRDYGIASFAVASLDLTLAATTTEDTFLGGLLSHVGGHTFLLAGTISTLLLVPLVITANRRAQRWLGRHWKWIQGLTYVVWGTVLIHLYLLFDLTGFFLDAILLSVPLVMLRLPLVRRWWSSSRRHRTRRAARAVAAVLLITVFLAGFAPFVQELAVKGATAFAQQPIDD